MQRNLTVTVSGTTNSGKSTVALAITRALQQLGLNAEMDMTKEDSDPYALHLFQDDRVAYLADKPHTITIKQVQLSRNSEVTSVS